MGENELSNHFSSPPEKRRRRSSQNVCVHKTKQQDLICCDLLKFSSSQQEGNNIHEFGAGQEGLRGSKRGGMRLNESEREDGN